MRSRLGKMLHPISASFMLAWRFRHYPELNWRGGREGRGRGRGRKGREKEEEEGREGGGGGGGFAGECLVEGGGWVGEGGGEIVGERENARWGEGRGRCKTGGEGGRKEAKKGSWGVSRKPRRGGAEAALRGNADDSRYCLSMTLGQLLHQLVYFTLFHSPTSQHQHSKADAACVYLLYACNSAQSCNTERILQHSPCSSKRNRSWACLLSALLAAEIMYLPQSSLHCFGKPGGSALLSDHLTQHIGSRQL